MTSTLDSTILTPQQRAVVGSDPNLGGATVLQVALATSPRPELPLVHLVRPLTDTDGALRHSASLLDLDRLADAWAAWYCEQGVRPRDRVAIYIEDSFAYSIHYFALARLGAIGVLINSWAPSSTANALCRQTTPVGIYSDSTRLEGLWREPACALGDMRWVQAAEELAGPPPGALPDARRYRHAPEDPVSILHSSGTTGHPKPVIQTHASSVAGPRFRMAGDADPPGELVLTALPQSHIGAISFSSYALLCGTPVIALYDPTSAQLLDVIRERRPTSVMGFSHIFTELATYGVPAGELDSVERWISVGDAIHEPHIRSLLAHRSPELPHAEFLDRLGTTELGWALLLHRSTIASGPKGRCAGRPNGAGEVVVLRRDGTEAAPGERGLLAARGPTVTVGYWNDCDTNYRSRLAGYWLTGDVAYRDEAGLFYQVDRAVDAIQTRSGHAYSVLMEETLLDSVADISDCGVVAGRRDGETVAVALVRTPSGAGDADRLLATANEALRAAQLPELTVLEIAAGDADYPVGVTGKVLKRVLRERYGDLSGYLRHAGDRNVAAAAG